MILKTGLGYDLHTLVENRKLLIGGVHIPFEKGEKAHSDGDVLLHAITDALLGASCMGDIGSLFPPEKSEWKDANSKDLLAMAWELIKQQGWEIQNIDCIIVLEKPKLIPYRDSIRTSIAEILSITIEQIFVKAKTKEGVGAVGKGEAIEAWANCLLAKKN